MKRIWKRCAAALMTLSMAIGMSVPAHAAVTNSEVAAAVQDTAKYVYTMVQDPQVGSIGGEWAVLGLARSGYEVPDSYYQDYYATVEEYVEACDGVLHDKKYTEYSRVIVALSAIGKDARDVAGYDLTKPLGDYEKTIWQGLNGPIWALIALDSASYPMPKNLEAETQATRQMYIDRILECQLPDGGWSLFGGTESETASDGTADPDITGMALQALAKYQDQPAVAQATQEALACMSEQQSDDGGFSSWGTANAESCVQMIVALCELGIDLDDPRFVKNGNTMLDNLMTFYRKGEGFLHTQSGSGSNQMATEQGFYGLVAVQRAAEGNSSLYRMSDALSIPDAVETETAKGQGLEGKDPAVTAQPITSPGKTFPDIVFSDQITAIEALAARGIIDGKSDGNFDPTGSMTRAEFATIVVRALGLTPVDTGAFVDVDSTAWYASYVGAASTYALINGVGEGRFNPDGTITRQEAAVMVSRAAQLCGLETEMDTAAVRNMLAQFPDYMTSAEWARAQLAFCYQEGILSQTELNIRPQDAVTRAEVAQMLFNLLSSADLL